MSHHTPRSGRAAAALCLILLTVLPVNAAAESAPAAAEDAAGVIMARQKQFKEMGKAMKFLRTALRGPAQPDAETLGSATSVILGSAGSIADWFPDGSGPESGLATDALPYIWKTPDRFAALDEQLVSAARAMLGAIESGAPGAMQGALRELANACSQCHDSYRAD